MSNVIPFDFNGAPIRVVEGRGEPWFVAKDVADLLGYAKSRNAISAHCKGALKQGVPTESGIQEMQIIPERDVYRLIMRSKLPEAEKFEEWVVGEVLPSVRKTGGYGLPSIDLDNPEVVANLLSQTLGKVQEQRALISDLTPKAKFHDQVAAAPDAISVAKAAKIIGTGQRRLFAFLRKEGWVSRRNEPYQTKIESHYMDVKIQDFQHPNNGLSQSITPLVTGKGLTKLKQLWDSREVAA